MLLGAHLSSAGGLSQALVRAQKLNINSLQTFASSPRSIHFNPVSRKEIDTYHLYRDTAGVSFHVFHGVYLINLAHEKQEYVDLCVKSLLGYQTTAAAIGGFGTVFHVGSHKGRGLDAYLEQISHAIGQVVVTMSPNVWLLLEMAAGQNGVIGQSFLELNQIIQRVTKLGYPTHHLGVGIDTQHAFASGYDLRIPAGLNSLIQDINQSVGIDKIKLIHLNDSLTDFASHRDRHANIGEGQIGSTGLAQCINHPILRDIPVIIEVPGRNKTGPSQEDIAALKKLVKSPAS